VDARHITIGPAQVAVFSKSEEMFSAAAQEFFRVLTGALGQRDSVNVALSGGSTPRELYKLIAKRAVQDPAFKAIDWRKVHFFFGDERCVPPSDPQSNYRMVRESLLSNSALGSAHVHRIRAELPAAEAAAEYQADLKQHFGGAVPRFDLILLGLGPDGHTASLFPNTAALTETDRWVVANAVPQQNATRITFTYPVLNNSSEVLFLVAGAEKAEALQRALITHDVPAAKVQPRGSLLWFVDADAAAALPTSS
jgi:6-phosphogluconolactonase